MKKVISLCTTAFIYFCVATVIAQAAALSALWAKGALDRGRLYRVLAALHGVDVVTMQTQLLSQKQATEQEQPAFDTQLEAQTLKSLDLDLRETVLDKGLVDLRNLQTSVRTEEAAFTQQRLAYDARLKDMVETVQTSSMKDLQRTIEAMRPAQAKEQLLKMLADQAKGDVVTIVKNMPADKQKKIVAEFKAGTDADQLYEILKLIRAGEPVASLIEDARQQLSPQ
ncbi:MAG: hypothetical protein GXY58_12720 [Planctomycetaceae bacterium]|nr:hypothetical protein [Planctomycetaceae bacterium]